MKSLIILLFIVIFSFSIAKGQIISPLVDSIPTRDGKNLAADIYIPDTSSGDQYSTILIQTPYNRKWYRWTGLPMGIGNAIDSSRFAFVIIDWRCFYGSASACIPSPRRGEDGYDVIEWIIGQDWSNGSVGTWGLSALGKIQFMTAKEHHPAHICAVPLVAAPQYVYNEYYPGGALRTEYIEQLDALGFGLGELIYNHQIYDLTWEYLENTTFYPQEIDIPTLMIGGWYDHNINVMMEFYSALADSSTLDDHYLLFGPWAHGSVGETEQGELFYPEAEGWSDSLALQFFDYYLDDVQNGWPENELITYFEMGNNTWHTSADWPPENITYQTWYLHEDYIIKQEPPTTADHFKEIIYDPADPSPTVGGATLRTDLLQGPYDQAPEVESRDDVLVFSTEPLLNTLSIAGKTKIFLAMSSDRKDTDITVRLTDVYPDGRSMLLFSGIQRMRFRDGFTAIDTSAMFPGEIYNIEIELPDQAISFLPGHRLRLDISSSNYPRFDCNLNNGGSMYTSGDTLIAHNKIYVNAQNISWIEIPVIDYSTEITDNYHFKMSTNIYPLPVINSSVLKIKTDHAHEIEVALMDIYGKTVSKLFDGRVDRSGLILQLNNDNYQGLYFVNLKGRGINHTEKVVFIQ